MAGYIAPTTPRIPGKPNATKKERLAYGKMSADERQAFDNQNEAMTSTGGQTRLGDPDKNLAQAKRRGGNTLHPGEGTVQSDGAPLDPEQQFEAERRGLDPLTDDTAIANPYVDTDWRTQRASALMNDNRTLAREAYGMRPGVDAYTVNPEMYQTMEWSPDERYSYEKNINQKRTDTTGLDAQTKALQGYDDIYSQGGLTAIDRARIAQSHQAGEQELRANREAIMQNAQEQGRAGGNAQLLAQMQAGQGTANQRAMDDLQTNALALQRRDSALGAMGDLGGSVQTAQDSIDRFNTEGKRTLQERNIERKNQGIDVKYQDERGTRNANVDTKNAADQLNKSAGYGARGAYSDQIDAIQGIQNANEAQAAHETNRQANIVQQRQQNQANNLAAAGAATGVVGNAANYAIDHFTRKKKEPA